ncbi:hypothetical protein E5676_scaffold481G00120 [Cucumis melo var. makuwa]|uniref:Uncharacterized protein n=1 Tax=Cucumis melo var. makuwa TaxID=1194695 RepID=A0A5D3D553_CUCMM|nr:hypothetical protein E5676_scaffold481G00120 [Cucumis melo var. makuwa]
MHRTYSDQWTVMVDKRREKYWATLNFISEKLVKKLVIPTKETTEYGVILGSGTTIQGKGVCEALEVQLKDWTVKEDFLPLELGDVFEWPERLPLKRDIEHQIHLKKGTDPINVRPYRYGYYKKEEMEKLVKEMLASGVVRPNTSPFSSPVLLVKKKDASWCFCVDYRAVNNSTIPDKFPIPVVEELFDELCGASLFSKIDLKSSKNEADHVKHMGVVLSVLRKHELYANKKKCSFTQHKIEYLGHVISGGVEVNPKKKSR